MAGEHVGVMRTAIKNMRTKRREAIETLNTANNAHNRGEFLQIDQTLKALQAALHEESHMD